MPAKITKTFEVEFPSWEEASRIFSDDRLHQFLKEAETTGHNALKFSVREPGKPREVFWTGSCKTIKEMRFFRHSGEFFFSTITYLDEKDFIQWQDKEEILANALKEKRWGVRFEDLFENWFDVSLKDSTLNLCTKSSEIAFALKRQSNKILVTAKRLGFERLVIDFISQKGRRFALVSESTQRQEERLQRVREWLRKEGISIEFVRVELRRNQLRLVCSALVYSAVMAIIHGLEFDGSVRVERI